ncbi:cyclin-D1-binding protein 1 homolog isoform X2 [Babylonia areolata]
MEKFNPDKYWDHLGAVLKAVSMEGTKFSLAFTSPPYPSAKESGGMVSSLEKTVLELVSMFYSLPKTQGMTLRKILQKAVVEILESVQTLVTSLAQLDPGSSERKQATGVVWEGVSIYPRLPRNNNEAATQTLEQSAAFVGDALEELEETIAKDGHCDEIFWEEDEEGEEDRDNTLTWTDQEKEMAGPVKGLIKTASKLLGKAREANTARGRCDSDDQVAQLDDLSDCAQQLSPAVDDLASCMYAPMNHTAVRSNAVGLSDVVSNMVSILRHSHVTVEGDAKWLDFLQKANTHNLTTLQHVMDK